MILRWTITAWLSIFVHAAGSSSPGHYQAPQSPETHFQRTGHIPMGHLVTAQLKKNETRRFKLTSETTKSPLSIAVTPCSSSVFWSVYFSNSSSDMKRAVLLDEFQSDFLDTFKVDSSRVGFYITEMTAFVEDTSVQIYASQKPDPHHETRMAQKTRVKLQKKQDRRKITVKWDASSIDPHITEYCLVVSTAARNYTSLCAYGHGPAPVKGNTSKMGSSREPGVLVSCVGPKTYHSVDNLENGMKYFLTLFAVNTQNNMTFPYGSTSVVYDQRIKHAKLKDGKSEKVNLKELDGKAVFKFKAGRQTGETMSISVMPCGGAVDVVVTLEGRVVARKNRLFSYGHILVHSVRFGQRYTIKILSSNSEELKKTSGVEVLATAKKHLPLPQLPNEPIVKQYANSCDSVTVGWLPSPDPKTIRYCVVIKEREKEGESRQPNQCTLEKRLHKRANYNTMKCRNLKPTDDRNKVMVEEIKGLKPDRKYVVQVTVKKAGGRALSYDLLTARTSPRCL